jgi:uncharacterized membrane protein YoaK (UPF0700 family)
MIQASVPSTRTRDSLLLALSFAAGYVDALSYLGLNRVLTANMTGNTVLLAIGLAQLDTDAAIRSSVALAGFLGGAAVGAWMVERDRSEEPWPRVVTLALTVEAVILCVFAAGWQWVGDTPAPLPLAILIVLSALAMGVQSAAVRRLEVSGIATTYITGTLTQLVARFMRPTPQNSNPRSRHRMLLGAVWVVYFGGAAVAAIDLRLSSLVAQVLPIAVVLCVVVMAALAFRASPSSH